MPRTSQSTHPARNLQARPDPVVMAPALVRGKHVQPEARLARNIGRMAKLMAARITTCVASLIGNRRVSDARLWAGSARRGLWADPKTQTAPNTPRHSCAGTTFVSDTGAWPWGHTPPPYLPELRVRPDSRCPMSKGKRRMYARRRLRACGRRTGSSGRCWSAGRWPMCRS